MFRLYLDEVGTDDLVKLDEDNHRFFSLTGVIVEISHVTQVLQPKINAIQNDCFSPDPDDPPICLHRSDIVRRRGVFGRLNENDLRQKFDNHVRELFSDVDYKVITILVDKLEMTRQPHWQNKHPYHYLMEVMVEKYAQFLKRANDIGDIMPEGRRGKKDTALQEAFSYVRENGTHYVNSSTIQSHIRASKLKFRFKGDNIAGLQLCDLLAHPSHMNVRYMEGHAVELGAFASETISILNENKYDRSRYGKIRGYGYKLLP